MPKFNGYNEEHPERSKELVIADKFQDKRDEVGQTAKGKKDFAKAMKQIDDQEARDERDRATKNSAPLTKVDGVEYGRGRVTEPRCGVCQHPYRDWIETMLIRGASYKSLERRIPPNPGHNVLDRRSISNHHKKHMDLKDAALIAILHKEAELQDSNFAEGVQDAITKRGALEVALRRGLDDIVNNVTTVEPRDLIQVVKLLGEMDSHQQQVGLDELRSQVQIFINAIKNVCSRYPDGEAIRNDIAREVKKLREEENISKTMEDVMAGPTPPPLPQVTDEEIMDAEVVG